MSQRALVNHYFGSENCACLHWAQTVTVRSQDLRYKLKVHATTCIGLAIHHTNIPVLSATRVSATTPSGTLSASCGSTRCPAASLVDWWPSRLLAHRPQTNDSSGCRRHQAWCGGHFLLSWWHAVLLWGLWPCHCCQMLCGLGKVPETIACPHLQAPLS